MGWLWRPTHSAALGRCYRDCVGLSVGTFAVIGYGRGVCRVVGQRLLPPAVGLNHLLIPVLGHLR